MNRAAKLLSVAAVVLNIGFLGSTTLADNARGHGAGRFGGGRSIGFSSGFRGGFRGGSSGRFISGFRGGFYGGYRHYYGGGSGCYPLNSSCGYGYSAPSCDYYYYPGPATRVYYSSPPVVYSSPPPVVYTLPPPAPEAEHSQQPAVDRPLSLPTVIHGTPSPSSSPEAQPQPPTQYSPQNQSLGVADVKALAKAGLSDAIILNQIRNSRVVYHLTAVEIIDLKESGVSEKVIDSMINTPPAGSTVSDVRFKLTGIMGEPKGGFSAVVNGKSVVENSYVDGAKVKKIDRDQVALDLDGHEVVIRLF